MALCLEIPALPLETPWRCASKPQVRRTSKPLGTNFETKIVKFRWFLGPSDQNELYHTPLLSKIWDLGDRNFFWWRIPLNTTLLYTLYHLCYAVICLQSAKTRLNLYTWSKSTSDQGQNIMMRSQAENHFIPFLKANASNVKFVSWISPKTKRRLLCDRWSEQEESLGVHCALCNVTTTTKISQCSSANGCLTKAEMSNTGRINLAHTEGRQ